MASENGEYAGTDDEFCRSLHNFQQYPDNIPQGPDRPKLVQVFKHHFEKTKNKITLIPRGRPSRYKATLKKVRLFIHDCGIRLNPEEPSPGHDDAPPTPDSSGLLNAASDMGWNILQPHDLETLLGFSQADRQSFDSERLEDGRVHVGDFCLTADPVCRFIFLETSPATGGRRLKITESMLLQLLTYHHVSPSFLNFISYFGHLPLTGDSDLLFGGLRSLKSFSGSQFRVPALDRSGLHYQLVFELKTVFDPRNWNEDDGNEEDDDMAACDPPEPRRRAFFWPRRQDDNIICETEEGEQTEDPWPIMRTAIYHHFDVVNGKCLWIITTGDKKPRQEYPFRPEYLDVKDALGSIKVSADTPIRKRFESSLEVLVWLMEWSLSEYGFYIATLDDSLETLTRPLVKKEKNFDTIEEKELKVVNRYMESLDECIVGLKANMRVARALHKFYRRELFQDDKLKALKLPWITEARKALNKDVENTAASLQSICSATNDMLRRAIMVKQVGTRREDMIHRLLQNRNEQTMKDLADLTYRDSTTMRIFSTITLILLPMSVVSTLFTTDIVHFQNIDNFTGNWSGPAAIWWSAATLLTTLVVFFAGEAWRQSAIDKVMARKGKGQSPPRPARWRISRLVFPPFPGSSSGATGFPWFSNFTSLAKFDSKRREDDPPRIRNRRSEFTQYDDGKSDGKTEWDFLGVRTVVRELSRWRSRSSSKTTAGVSRVVHDELPEQVAPPSLRDFSVEEVQVGRRSVGDEERGFG